MAYQQDALDHDNRQDARLALLDRDEGPALTPPSRGSYRDPSRLSSSDAEVSQRCGGGRRVIRKAIRSN